MVFLIFVFFFVLYLIGIVKFFFFVMLLIMLWIVFGSEFCEILVFVVMFIEYLFLDKVMVICFFILWEVLIISVDFMGYVEMGYICIL